MSKAIINWFLFTALGLNVLFWLGTHNAFVKWPGVPPVPTKAGAVMMALGDSEFAYRTLALTLQNLGDAGGHYAALKDYDYNKISQWLWLLHDLDPASDHVPLLAAYYFGGTPVDKDIGVIVEYLGKIGENPAGEKWRWLAHAAYLARHRMHDLQRALDLAYKLSKMQPVGDELPIWAKHMPASILEEKGDKDAAREIVENLLLSKDRFNKNEVNFMKGYLIEQLGVAPKEVNRLIGLRGPDSLNNIP